MQILVTGSRSKLGAAIGAALQAEHDVRTLDLPGGAGGNAPALAGDPRDRELAVEAVRDCGAVVHLLPEPGATTSPSDLLDAATRGTYNLITQVAPGARFVLLSSLRTFERYPMDWLVNENWAPRPTTEPADLASYLAEITTREVIRAQPTKAIVLRLGEVVDDDDVRGRAPDQRWLHVDDAVQAVQRALAFAPAAEAYAGWWVFHICAAGRSTRFPLGQAGQKAFGFEPRHDFGVKAPTPGPSPNSGGGETERRRTPGDLPPALGGRGGLASGAARKVVIYGAGGPLASVTTQALLADHELRLADLRPLAEIAAGPPQSPGAPLPRPLDSPHEQRLVDVTDPDQVLEAARGMDAIINCTVIRPHPVEAFRVNMLGAYHVMRAAVAHGIRRVVHTGPTQAILNNPAGYQYDFGIPADAPPRPGNNLYILTKLLGQEICRIFAEEHHLEVPALLFSIFVNPDNPPRGPLGPHPFSVSWEDAGQALRLALHAPSYPSPFEVFQIVGDLPHGKYTNDKAKRLLNWQPRDRLQAHWTRPEL